MTKSEVWQWFRIQLDVFQFAASLPSPSHSALHSHHTPSSTATGLLSTNLWCNIPTVCLAASEEKGDTPIVLTAQMKVANDANDDVMLLQYFSMPASANTVVS